MKQPPRRLFFFTEVALWETTLASVKTRTFPVQFSLISNSCFFADFATDLVDIEIWRVFLLYRIPMMYSLVELTKLTDLVRIRSPLRCQLTLKWPCLKYLNSFTEGSRLKSTLMISAFSRSLAASILPSLRPL